MSFTPHFLIQEYAHGWFGSTLQIKVKTDIQCHLWARITDKELRTHQRAVLHRGTMWMANPEFCFVEYTEVEQLEPGDTYYHIFHVPTFPPYSFRWYYMHGEVAEKPSPSLSPVFEVKHKPEYQEPSLWEPWGEWLDANHPWYLFGEHPGSDITLANGRIILHSALPQDYGVVCLPRSAELPLQDPDGNPLRLRALIDSAGGDWFWHSCSIAFYFHKGLDRVWLEYVFSRGRYWELFRPPHEYWGGFRSSWYVNYLFERNLVEDFKDLRNHYGYDPNPDGWIMTEAILFGEGHWSATGIDIVSDYIHLYWLEAGHTFQAWQEEFQNIKKEENNMITLGIYDGIGTLQGEVKLEEGDAIELEKVEEHNSIKIKLLTEEAGIWKMLSEGHLSGANYYLLEWLGDYDFFKLFLSWKSTTTGRPWLRFNEIATPSYDLIAHWNSENAGPSRTKSMGMAQIQLPTGDVYATQPCIAELTIFAGDGNLHMLGKVAKDFSAANMLLQDFYVSTGLHRPLNSLLIGHTLGADFEIWHTLSAR